MVKPNVTIKGRCAPAYMAEYEYYDFIQRKKVVERMWPKEPSEIKQFRESLMNVDFIDFGEKLKNESRILTGFRIYKGDEIVYDRYCPMTELSTLNMLFMKVSSFKK